MSHYRDILARFEILDCPTFEAVRNKFPKQGPTFLRKLIYLKGFRIAEDGRIEKSGKKAGHSHLRTDLLEIDVLEISENQEMKCPLGCSEIDEPFECGRRFKRWLMRQPVEEELVYTVVLLEVRNVSTEKTESISILPEKTQVFDSSGNSYDGCSYMCRTLFQTLEEKYKTTLSEIEIPPGSKKRLLLLYPEIAPGKRITKLTIDTYVSRGWSRSFLESCTLSFEHKELEEKIMKEKPIETAISHSHDQSTPESKSGLDGQPLKQDLDRLPVTTCEICGKPLFEPRRRFCSINCLTTYTRREREERKSTREPESSLESESLKQGLIKFRDEFGNHKWGTVEETAEALLPRLGEWARNKEIRAIKWMNVSAFLNTQEIVLRYTQTKTRLINALFIESARARWRTQEKNQRPSSITDEPSNALDGDSRCCPECGGRRLRRHGNLNELLCMDCYFVVTCE